MNREAIQGSIPKMCTKNPFKMRMICKTREERILFVPLTFVSANVENEINKSFVKISPNH